MPFLDAFSGELTKMALTDSQKRRLAAGIGTGLGVGTALTAPTILDAPRILSGIEAKSSLEQLSPELRDVLRKIVKTHAAKRALLGFGVIGPLAGTSVYLLSGLAEGKKGRKQK